MQDRRKHPRLQDQRRISVALLPEHPGPDRGVVTVSAEARDLALDGMRITTFTAMMERAFVRVDVPVPGAARRRLLSMAGLVRWCRLLPGENHYTLGIEFFDLRDLDRQDWNRLVRALTS